jgi:hypothetical protein
MRFQVTRVRRTDPNLRKGETVLGGGGQVGSRTVSYINGKTSSLGPDIVGGMAASRLYT